MGSNYTFAQPSSYGFALTATAIQVLPFNPSRLSVLFHNPNFAGQLNIWLAPGVGPNAGQPNGGPFTALAGAAGSLVLFPGADRIFLPPQFVTCAWTAVMEAGHVGNITILEFIG